MKITGYLLITVLFLALVPLSSCGPDDRGGDTPVAVAGQDQNVKTGSLVSLDGSNSYDANPDTLYYRWEFTTIPDDSSAVLSGQTSVNPTFFVDVDGAYVLSLIVNDGNLTSTENTVTITATTDNSAPVANAGADQNVETGSLVTLDGSSSSDANNDTLSYAWTFSSVPAGSGVGLSEPSIVNPTFIADIDGPYVLSLIVDDGLLTSTVNMVTITATTDNSAPVANAGADQNVETGSLVTLNGSSSSDANNDTLSYAWTFNSRPPGSSVSLSDPSPVNPIFIADMDGSYVLNLVVNDGLLDSAVDVVIITASTTNSAPVADAGADQNIETGSLVTLDGSGSSDANNDILSYAWTFNSVPGGSDVTLSDPSTANPTFIADMDGSYVLNLVVNDGSVDSAVDTVIITAATANSAPVADASADQDIATGSQVTLDGSGSSDANDDTLGYAWTLNSMPVGSDVTLSDPNIVNPTFIADMDGSYVLNLVVNDGSVDSAVDTVIITAATANSPPIADAGADQDIDTGSTVTLDGSGSSDTDNDPLTYNWSFDSRPNNSTAPLSDPTAESPSFTPDLDGSYTLNLIVNDGTVDSTVSTVTITATTVNSPPVADADADQNIATGSLVTLDGSSSSDTDNDPLTYNWSFDSRPKGSKAALSDPAAESPSFTADRDGSYILDLVVNDGTVDSAVDTVTITATTVNSPPVADAGANQTVDVGTTVSLDGSGSEDVDGDDLTYDWTFIESAGGTGVTLTGGTTATPSFSADNVGAYVLDLIVNDGTEDSAASTVTITSQ